MAAAHSWHPGSSCVNSRWAASIPLLPDELFSSWLARAALSQGCDPLVLTGEVWPGWRVWTLDPDRGPDADRLEALAKASGIGAAAFKAGTLRPVAEAVGAGLSGDRSIWPWMLALGSRNRKRYGGLQYCPACFAEDKKAYFRMQWRFAWHTACSSDGCLLHDCCPHCNAPIEPHRLSAMDGHLAICARCKADLRGAKGTEAAFDALAFQQAADDVVFRSEGAYGQERLAVGDWFALARYFVGLLRKVALGKSGSLSALMRSLGIDAARLEAPATGLAFELLPVEERASLLGSAWKVLATGPDAFLSAAKETFVTAQTLREPHQTLPTCLERIVEALPERRVVRVRRPAGATTKPRSREAVVRMWARLQRKMPMAAR